MFTSYLNMSLSSPTFSVEFEIFDGKTFRFKLKIQRKTTVF